MSTLIALPGTRQPVAARLTPQEERTVALEMAVSDLRAVLAFADGYLEINPLTERMRQSLREDLRTQTARALGRLDGARRPSLIPASWVPALTCLHEGAGPDAECFDPPSEPADYPERVYSGAYVEPFDGTDLQQEASRA